MTARRAAVAAKAAGPTQARRADRPSRTSATGMTSTRQRGARVVTKLASFTAVELSSKTGERTTSQAAGIIGSSDSPYHRSSRARPGADSNGSRSTTSPAAIGATTAGWVIWARAPSSAAHPGRPRRQAATAAISSAAPHVNGIWPMSAAATTAGFSSTVAAPQLRRSSGKARNVAATRPAMPSTSHSVTIQSPARGRATAAVSHGTTP